MAPVEQKSVNRNSTNISNLEKSQKTVKSKKTKNPPGGEKSRTSRAPERSQACRTRPEKSRIDRGNPERSQTIRTNQEKSLAPRTQPEKSIAVRSQAIRKNPPPPPPAAAPKRINEMERSSTVTQKTIKEKKDPEEKSGFFQFGRTVKQFISRPLNDESLKSLVTKVKNRSTSITRKTVDFGEDVFVTMRNRRASTELVPSPIQIVPEEVDADGSDIMSSHSELAKVTSNPDNNEQIFIGRRPFWFVPSDAPSDEDMKGIFESPEISAQNLIEVSEGRKTLKTVSAPPISMDPFVDLDIMKGRDSVFFSNDVIFSNTVRSIINTNNLMQSIKMTKRRKETAKKVKITEPTITLFYKRRTRKKTREDKFVHQFDPKKKK